MSGYAFVYNQGTSEWEKRPDRRTRVIPLDMDSVHPAVVDRHLVATDRAYTLDINESGTLA